MWHCIYATCYAISPNLFSLLNVCWGFCNNLHFCYKWICCPCQRLLCWTTWIINIQYITSSACKAVCSRQPSTWANNEKHIWCLLKSHFYIIMYLCLLMFVWREWHCFLSLTVFAICPLFPPLSLMPLPSSLLQVSWGSHLIHILRVTCIWQIEDDQHIGVWYYCNGFSVRSTKGFSCRRIG